MIKKYPYKEMCKHICIDVIHSSQNIVSIKTQQGMFEYSKPFGLLSKILVLIWKICFEITRLLNMSYKLRQLSRNFAAEINKI